MSSVGVAIVKSLYYILYTTIIYFRKMEQIQTTLNHDANVYKCPMCHKIYLDRDLYEKHVLKHNFDTLKQMCDDLHQQWIQSGQTLNNSIESQISFAEMHNSMVKLTNSVIQDNFRDILVDNLAFKEKYLKENPEFQKKLDEIKMLSGFKKISVEKEPNTAKSKQENQTDKFDDEKNSKVPKKLLDTEDSCNYGPQSESE